MSSPVACPDILFWLLQVRLASVAENGFNAVERVSEFCELPQEAPEEIAGSKPDDWPDMGKVGSSPEAVHVGNYWSTTILSAPCLFCSPLLVVRLHVDLCSCRPGAESLRCMPIPSTSMLGHTTHSDM